MRTEKELKYLLSELIDKRNFWLRVVKENYQLWHDLGLKGSITGERELAKFENQIEIVRYALADIDYLS